MISFPLVSSYIKEKGDVIYPRINEDGVVKKKKKPIVTRETLMHSYINLSNTNYF